MSINSDKDSLLVGLLLVRGAVPLKLPLAIILRGRAIDGQQRAAVLAVADPGQGAELLGDLPGVLLGVFYDDDGAGVDEGGPGDGIGTLEASSESRYKR